MRGPTFGEILRGARLGWHWNGQRFVKITPYHANGPDCWRVQWGPTVRQAQPEKGVNHVVWWEHHEVLDYMDPGIMKTRPLNEHGECLVGSDGKRWKRDAITKASDETENERRKR